VRYLLLALILDKVSSIYAYLAKDGSSRYIPRGKTATFRGFFLYFLLMVLQPTRGYTQFWIDQNYLRLVLLQA